MGSHAVHVSHARSITHPFCGFLRRAAELCRLLQGQVFSAAMRV